jgi:hypothetical protein
MAVALPLRRMQPDEGPRVTTESPVRPSEQAVTVPGTRRDGNLISRLDTLSPAHLAAIALTLAACVIALAPPADPDVWWHLRTGDLILATHHLPGKDPWSLVAAGRPWVTHEWLSQVIIALFHKAFGLHGVSLYRSLGVTVLIGSLAMQSFRRTSPYRALGITTLAFFATTGGWGERPQLLSFLLLIPVAQLVRAAADGRRSPWWLVPVTYLWANLHGLWILGLALLGVAVLGVLWEQGWACGRDRASRLTTVGVCCVAVAGLTPNGPALLLEPLRVRGYAQFVAEWGAPSVHTAFGAAFFAMLATALIVVARTDRPVPRYLLLQILFAATLGVLYIRTVAPAAVLLTPLVADLLGPRLAPRGHLPLRSRAILNGSLLGLIGVTAIAGATYALTAFPSLAPAAPVRATAALTALSPAPQRVINEYGIGGWLLGRAPSAQPAIDGRTEIYPVEYVRKYLGALRMQGNWRATIVPLQANAALLHPDTPLVNGLRDDLHWRTVFADANWVVLAPPLTPAGGVR